MCHKIDRQNDSCINGLNTILDLVNLLPALLKSLQGVRLPTALKATSSIDQLIEHTEVFLMVVPTPFVAATMAAVKDKLKPNQVDLMCKHSVCKAC